MQLVLFLFPHMLALRNPPPCPPSPTVFCSLTWLQVVKLGSEGRGIRHLYALKVRAAAAAAVTYSLLQCLSERERANGASSSVTLPDLFTGAAWKQLNHHVISSRSSAMSCSRNSFSSSHSTAVTQLSASLASDLSAKKALALATSSRTTTCRCPSASSARPPPSPSSSAS
eukprot:748095-Hanusia_phi.AAC.3